MMKKRFLVIALCGLLSMSIFTGCSNNLNHSNESNNIGSEPTTHSNGSTAKFQMLDTDLKIGMVTDSGTIDDRSFNQSTWEGVKSTVKNHKYLRPSGVTDADYLESITNLYDADYKFIIGPGYKLERAFAIAQDKYSDAKFVILDGSPTDENGNVVIGDNTVAIHFAEQESGFLAGVAAAVEIKDAEFGFIGGMKFPGVQKFNYGFQQGLNYANENLGTNIILKAENVIYQGAFDDKAGGQQVAAQMYDKGVKVIFTAAGGTGIGAITEAKSRATNGDTSVYIIGVDIDQYADGVYDQSTNASVILTSAMKYIDHATNSIITTYVEGNFPGGQTLTLSVANEGVGIPSENPNLSQETIHTVNATYEKIKSGALIVSPENTGSLID